MIKKIKEIFETQTTLLKKKAGIFKEEEVECAIDEVIVDCKEIDKDPYIGVPAPIIPNNDPWFNPPIVSEFNKDYMELEHQAFKEEAHKFYGTKEPENIHEVMYEMATKSFPTTLQLDPPSIGGSENFQGGSENVHR